MNFLKNNISRIGSIFLIYLLIFSLTIFFVTFFYNIAFIKIKNEEKQKICSHDWVFITQNSNNLKIKCKKCNIDYYTWERKE